MAGAMREADAKDLNFSVMQSGTYDKAAAEIAADFTKKTGTNVKISAFPWAVLRQNNTTDLISGTGQYDVMSGGYYLADVYSYFTSLADYIAKDHYGDGIIPGLMQPGRSEYLNGKEIGIPYGVDAFGLIYNKDVLAAAGVTAKFDTWADLIAACEKIKAAGKGVACFSHPTGSPEQIGAFFFSGYDGPYVAADGKYALDAAKAAAVAQDIAKLWKYLPEKGTALTFDEAAQLFSDGKAAMLIDWPSFVTRQLDSDKSAVKGKWAMAKFPGPGFPWLSLWQLFVPETTKDKDAAWAWIKAYAGPDNAKRNLVEHNIGSVWLATYDDPDLKAKNAHFWPALLQGFAAAKNPPLSGEAQDALTNTLQDIANGRVSPAAGIASVNQKWASVPVPTPLAEAAKAAGLAAH
ncbi:MAG: extracellular solute-binding protein [Devosia sp.]|nr:extracellular solute-binding protein [Devosia sp.]